MPTVMDVSTNMEMRTKSLILYGNPHQSSIDLCGRCAQICGECMTLLLEQDGAKEKMNCIKSLQDCAEICSTASCFMSRGSGSIKEISLLCSTICERCATECSLVKDDHCQICAEVCRDCADECKKMYTT